MIFFIDSNVKYQFCKGWHCLNYITKNFGAGGKKVEHPDFLCEKKKKRKADVEAEPKNSKKAKEALNLSGNTDNEQ